jgi:ribonuclease P protein component
LRVQRVGARCQTPHLVMYAARFSDKARVRLGTTVSRRLGNAVVRNRTRRRIREYFRRELRFRFPAGISVVVIGRIGAEALAMRSLMNELDDAFERLGPRLCQDHE